jgi:hypothetical protein
MTVPCGRHHRGLPHLYDIDPHAWVRDQADKLRGIARSLPALGLDFPHLIEELDGMAGADRARVESLAGAIIQHLLRLEHSPATEPRRHWKSEVLDFRRGLNRTLTASLRHLLAERLDRVFDESRADAAAKMRLYHEDPAGLPLQRPYSLEHILDADWWPPERAG